jgi:acyl-CoA reductase-like NAD-dependent aldehyde dehydrogenase
MDHKYNILIDGKLQQASDNAEMEIVNPADGNAFAVVPKGSPAEVQRAVEAAWKAQGTWASMYAGDRGKFLFKIAELIRKHYDELWRLETMQYGGPMSKTANFDIPVAAEMLEWMAGIGRGLSGLTLPVGSSARAMTVREPLGVLGLITPWNFPLITAIAKISPALITGNTCVVKPPSCAPLTVLRLAEFAVEAGLPAGVLNVITGPGNTVGEALVVHPKVAKINFTGDSSTGKRIMSLASSAVKPVASELGGKNAFIVMNDADLDATIEGAVWGSFFNAGQNCGSCSRFFVQESIYDQFTERFVAAAGKLTVGDPLKPETMVGPVAYKGHRDGIERFIEGAKKSGGRLLLGGERPSTPDTKNGCFVAPTIFADCDPKSEFMQEEIFGPVVGLTRFKTPEEAIALTNDTRYGLCASVWTKDVRQGMVMANQIKVGTVWINQHLAIVFEIPWGGCKESGWSKENSTLALEEYTMQKHLWIDLAGTPHTPWENLIRS